MRSRNSAAFVGISRGVGIIYNRILAVLLALVLILPVRADEKVPHCGIEAHTHTNSCYSQVQVLTCTKSDTIPEVHYHTPACYELQVVLDCTLDHTHTLDCYASKPVLVCTTPEGSLQCHQHTAECYTTQTVLTCTLPEHQHTSACYNDSTADRESQADWEDTLAEVELSGDPATDLIAVAETQIGYQESKDNLDPATGNGYTRYGAWAGSPYCDWCAAFICFCLSYAGIDYPHNLGCEGWIQDLTEAGLYSETATPLPGDLVFFSSDGGKTVGHVGILKELTEKTMVLIEGNSYNGRVDQVRYVTRSRTDCRIFGYGLVASREPESAEAADGVLSDSESDETALEEAGENDLSEPASAPEKATKKPSEEDEEAPVPPWVTAILSQLGTTCPPGTGPYGSWTGPDFSLRLMEQFSQFSTPALTQGQPQAGDIVWFDRERVGLVLYDGEDFLITIRVIGQTVTVASWSGPIAGYVTPYR